MANPNLSTFDGIGGAYTPTTQTPQIVGGVYDTKGRSLMPEPSSQPPQVHLEAGGVEESVQLIGKQVEELQHRLEVILHPLEVKANEPALKDNGEALAPHAQFLRIQNDRLRQISHRLADILRRLEV